MLYARADRWRSVAAIGTILIAIACTSDPKSQSNKIVPNPALSGATITIDEDMHDAPALADSICKGAGKAGAKLLESKDGKSAFQCLD